MIFFIRWMENPMSIRRLLDVFGCINVSFKESSLDLDPLQKDAISRSAFASLAQPAAPPSVQQTSPSSHPQYFLPTMFDPIAVPTLAGSRPRKQHTPPPLPFANHHPPQRCRKTRGPPLRLLFIGKPDNNKCWMSRTLGHTHTRACYSSW